MWNQGCDCRELRALSVTSSALVGEQVASSRSKASSTALRLIQGLKHNRTVIQVTLPTHSTVSTM
ncbi:hypothetical protein INR49_006763 [Caranx melampygus]|nr:hypothetical protein INR49_006763 [Caranx melampygus]